MCYLRGKSAAEVEELKRSLAARGIEFVSRYSFWAICRSEHDFRLYEPEEKRAVCEKILRPMRIGAPVSWLAFLAALGLTLRVSAWFNRPAGRLRGDAHRAGRLLYPPAPHDGEGRKMRIVCQLALYCALFTAIVKLAMRGGAVNGLFFYPKPVQECAIALGLTDRETIDRRFRRFMALFYIGMAAALVLIIGLWNAARDFKTAYLQALLFLEVMNWYDGLVIDKLWVGHSKF